uniref:UBC core domain-containing protein n=1 Tax=Panagrolaimus sp. JU765 TaxID=591449 RepID=A0AC34QE17_9BILA
PNGRFETNTKICLSISSYHPETWLPSWSISTALVALIAFMTTPGQGAIGALDCSDQQRRKLAKDSLKWCCSTCGCKMHEVGEELKAQIGKKECAKLPPINPDAGKGDADSNSSIASSSVSTVPEQPEVKPTPKVKPTSEKLTEPSIQPPVPQPISQNSIPQPPLVANVPVQQE